MRATERRVSFVSVLIHVGCAVHVVLPAQRCRPMLLRLLSSLKVCDALGPVVGQSNHDDDDDEAFERPLQPSPCLSDQIQETPKVSIAASLVGGTPAKYIHPRARERASGVDLLLAPPSVPQVPKGEYHRNRWGGYTAQNSGTWRNASRAAQPATVNIPSHCFLENVQFQGCTQVPSPYEGHLASQAQLPQVLCPPLDGNVAMPAPTSQGIPYGYWPPMGASLFPPQPGYGMPAPLSLQLGLPPSVNNLLPANFSYPLKVQGLMFPPQHLARH